MPTKLDIQQTLQAINRLTTETYSVSWTGGYRIRVLATRPPIHPRLRPLLPESDSTRSTDHQDPSSSFQSDHAPRRPTKPQPYTDPIPGPDQYWKNLTPVLPKATVYWCLRVLEEHLEGLI